MTKWLTRQEACHRFSNFLHWTVPGYRLELAAVSEIKPDDEDEEEEFGEPDSAEQSQGLGYSVAKVPAYPNTTITSIIKKFGAADFIPHLTKFLQTSPLTSRHVSAPVLGTQLPVYKCLTVRLPPAPQVTKHKTKNVIRARCGVLAHGKSAAIPEQFDMVLARESDSDETLDGAFSFTVLHTR